MILIRSMKFRQQTIHSQTDVLRTIRICDISSRGKQFSSIAEVKGNWLCFTHTHTHTHAHTYYCPFTILKQFLDFSIPSTAYYIYPHTKQQQQQKPKKQFNKHKMLLKDFSCMSHSDNMLFFILFSSFINSMRVHLSKTYITYTNMRHPRI